MVGCALKGNVGVRGHFEGGKQGVNRHEGLKGCGQIHTRGNTHGDRVMCGLTNPRLRRGNVSNTAA